MKYSTIFFDLDDTLYPPSSGLWEAIRINMREYMRERLGLPAEQIDALRQQYLETYGTTLRGLQHHYHVDTEDYLHYVHNLPLADFLHPDVAVRQMLDKLPQRKWIFTNADEAHARRVLQVLKLESCFEGIIDVRAIDFINKPEREAYLKALEIAGEGDARKCILLDDALRNLLPARQIGFTTVLVNPLPAQSSDGDGAHFHIRYLAELPRVLPGLWQKSNRPGSLQVEDTENAG